jgi:hypothetical protein
MIMLKRFIQTLTVIIVVSIFFSDTALAQKRRSQSRRPRSTGRVANRIQPLTQAQKVAIADLIAEGKRVEYQINYEPKKFADSGTLSMNSKCTKAGELLPDGNVKSLMLRLCQEYFDVGHLYGRVTDTGLFNAMERLEISKNPNSDTLPHLLERYGLQRATPFQAINTIFNIAIRDRELLEAVLYAAPFIPEPSNPTITPDNDRTTQPTP